MGKKIIIQTSESKAPAGQILGAHYPLLITYPRKLIVWRVLLSHRRRISRIFFFVVLILLFASVSCSWWPCRGSNLPVDVFVHKIHMHLLRNIYSKKLWFPILKTKWYDSTKFNVPHQLPFPIKLWERRFIQVQNFTVINVKRFHKRVYDRIF